jgi:hypothetical protein
MQTVERKYIVDENNKKIAVQLDIETFERMENALENYGLMKFILENQKDKKLSVSEAKAYYSTLEKNNEG